MTEDRRNTAASGGAGDASPVDSDRELLEARITAHALGELDPQERADVERLLAAPDRSEERRQSEEVRRLAAALKAGAIAAGGSRSAELRRAVLSAAADPARQHPGGTDTGVHSVSPAPRRSSWRWLAPLGGVAVAMLVAVTLVRVGTINRMVALRDPLVEQRNGRGVPATMDLRDESMVAPKAKAAADKAANLNAATDALGGRGRQLGERRLVEAETTADLDRLAPAPKPETAAMPRAAAREEQWRGGFDAEITKKQAGGEGYAPIVESRSHAPRQQPLSTFSIDVDTASYANVRRFLAAGGWPPRDAVRIEELVNYFHYDYPQPQGDAPFSVTVDATECPWKRGQRLVRIGLQGRAIDRGARPAGNIVFLIDVSGSMQAANKLALVKQALAMLVEELSENDRVSIVTYAGNAGLVLPPTTGDQKQAIRAAIEGLEAGGSTHGSAGIALAYEQAVEHFIPGGSNRVILATDGDLNVGVTSTSALIELIREKARAGVFLTVLGFGDGNLQDGKMEALADNGNGVYAYIDGVREARKVLVEQLTGSTVTIAKDVKIQVEFNPAQVASYRLLGYENRALAERDFRDDTKDAGEIGAGHSVTALYEITLVDEHGDGPGVEPLKYRPRSGSDGAPAETAAVDPDVSRELLTVKLRWKRPDAAESTGMEVALSDRGPAFDAAPADLRFAAAVAAFGMILRESPERGDATLPLVAGIAGKALGSDAGGYRAEFLDLVRRAEASR